MKNETETDHNCCATEVFEKRTESVSGWTGKSDGQGDQTTKVVAGNEKISTLKDFEPITNVIEPPDTKEGSEKAEAKSASGGGWAANAAGRSGLLSCSGSCFEALLSKKSTIIAMGENPDKFIDICFTAPTLALIYGDSVALAASKNDLKSFKNLIVVEGCRTGCASMMLDAMCIEPSARIYLSYAYRKNNCFAITPKDDEAINNAIPEVVNLILNAESSC